MCFYMCLIYFYENYDFSGDGLEKLNLQKKYVLRMKNQQLFK